MNGHAADLDIAAIARWMEGAVPGFRGPLMAKKFEGGQSNPTFRLDTPGRSYVLRRKPPGVLLKSAHAVEREFRVQRALAGTAVPVAEMLALCEDESVTGSTFFVMAYVPGRSFDDPSLPDLAPPERRAIYDTMNATLAAIHGVDIAAVGLSDYGKAGNYFRRQIDRWSAQYRASETETIPAMEELMVWLDANVPPDDGRVTLVHGDFRMDNLLFDEASPRCVAVLDWELSTLGHPFADLAGILMQWRMPVGREERGLAGLDRAAWGLPSDEAFIADYCRRTGIAPIEDFSFYVAFCFFRMAAIMQGVRKRGLDGIASNPERSLTMGALAPLYAALGIDAIAA
ncbi:phosphotransferase family protein [Acuticoccus kandeliae]|uniref:phosphotransferase family protein n=1 Tax=Acuticoccus kandeliae TaxID=2073160 RepID=UPI000D3E6454|nr:phosphotransferase family protein [Acuticoccus kandeliae]